MSLSFNDQMTQAIPNYINGTIRFQKINSLLLTNESWQKEAFENLKNLLKNMRKITASDIDLGSASSIHHVWYRVFGIKAPNLDVPQYSNDEITSMLLSIISEDQKEQLYKNRNLDFSLGIALEPGEDDSRFRGNIYYDTNHLVANFRRINQKVFKIETLGFHEPIIRRLNLRYEKSGLVLITGITGSGKSTTLDSIIDMCNNTNEAHMVIIGSPIEYIHKPNKCIIRHREVGEDVLSFQKGTIQALRQDPDIIVVGEMRDAETIATVLEVTDSGHKVYTTLHTSSAIDSIHRIIGEFPPAEQERIRNRLADTLKLAISQKLVPNKEGKYTMAKEILSVNASVSAAIRNNNIGEIYQMITEGKSKGMMTLEQDLFTLYRKGSITKENAMNYSNNRKRMLRFLGH